MRNEECGMRDARKEEGGRSKEKCERCEEGGRSKEVIGLPLATEGTQEGEM